MSLLEFNTDPSDRQLRQFAGLVLPLFAAVVGGLLGWRFDLWAVACAVVGVAVVVGVAGLLRPALARPIYRGWMRATAPIGWVVGHVILGGVFFVVLTPLGVLMRIFGRDPLHRKWDKGRWSYWERREPPADASRYFRQF
ncbi:MAG: sxtJ [Planctomycetes bacterium]|nr:sxtJ [Planctomycetota bacterium]